MSIFTGIEILFFSLGVLATAGVGTLLFLQSRRRLSAKFNLAAVAGLSLGLFGFAWSVSSILEGEPQAANMGAILFGLPALLLLSFSRRLALKERREETSE